MPAKPTDDHKQFMADSRRMMRMLKVMRSDLAEIRRTMVTKAEIAALGDRFDELSRVLIDWK